MADDQQALILKLSADITGMQRQLSAAVGIVDSSSGKMVLRSKEAAAAIEKSFGSINAAGFTEMLEKTAKLQDQLAAAQAAGNAVEAKALRGELALRGAVQKAATAQLETQLAIARAAGNKGQVAQLTEALALQSQISKFQGVGLTGSKALHEAEAAIVAIGAAEKTAEGANIGKALTSVFDSAKLATLEEGSTKLRIFGSALEPLGAAGIAAAAGIVALGVSLEEAHKAVEYADSLYKLAKNAHVTTDELQQMQFALRVSGGNAADASAGLQSFSATLGKAQAGLPKAQKGFLELGFSKAQIKGWDDAGTALDAVVEKIAGLKSNAQKDAVIQQLGLDQLKPLIEGGIDKWREFKAEAVASGNVMDEHLVKRGHELNDEIETATGKIKVQLSEAFVNLGPVLLKLLGYLADMASFAEKIAAATSPLEARGTTDLQRELRAYQARQASNDPLRFVYAKSDRENIARAQAELAKRAKEPAEKPPAGNGGLVDQTKPKPAKADDTLERVDQVDQTLAQADKQLQEALKGLTGNIDARAAFERKALQDELAVEAAKLQKDKDALDKDKGAGLKGPADQGRLAALADQVSNDQAITAEQRGRLLSEIGLAKTKRDELKAALDVAGATQAQATQAKLDLVNRQADYAKEDQMDEARKLLVDAITAQMEAAAAQATTAAERTQIERDILKLRQDEYTHEQGKKLSRQVASGEITDDQAAQSSADRQMTQAAERTQFDKAHENPIQKFQDEVQNFATTAQEAGVSAMQNLSSGLADAIVNAKSLGDVGKTVFRQLVADLLAAAIRKDIAAPLLAMIPGFASGTDYAPGGLALVGERGPELVNLPRGASVTPHFQTLSALQTMSTPTGAGGVIVQQFHLHAEGALMTDEYTARLDAMAQQHARREANGAYVRSLRDGRNGLPDALRAHQLLRG